MPLQPLTVLNVNSDKVTLDFTSSVMREAHFHVLDVANAQQAMALVCQRPDLIIVDTHGFCDICLATQVGGSFFMIPVLHIVSSLADVASRPACPMAVSCCKLQWPTSASILLAAVRALMLPAAPATTDNNEEAELLGRLQLATSYQIDRLGIVLEWGHSAENFFGWSAQEILGKFLPVADEIHHNEILSLISCVLHGQHIYSWETTGQMKNGRLLEISISMLPIFNASGLIERIKMVVADISENISLQDDLKKFSSVVLASSDIICIFTMTGEVKFLNTAGYLLLGLDVSGENNLSLENIFTERICAQIYQYTLSRTSSEAVCVEEFFLVDAEGNELPTSLQPVHIGPVGNNNFAIMARDIQQQKKAESNVCRLNRIYRMLEKCSQAIQEERSEKNLLSAVCRVLTDIGGYAFSLASLIIPDSGKKMQAAAWSGDDMVTAEDLVTSCSPDNERGRGPTGTAVHTGKVIIRNDIGQADEDSAWQDINERLGLRSMVALPLIHDEKIFGALSIYSENQNIFDANEVKLLQDLSSQIAYGINTFRRESARAESEAMLRLFSGAIESTLDGVMITDAQQADHQIIYVNPAFTSITGWEAGEVFGKSGRILVADELQQPEIEVIRHALRGRTTGQTVLRCFRKDGQPFWCELHVAPISNAMQEVTHYVSVISDVSERIFRETQLAHLATHDALTGLANRTLLNDRLRQAIARAQRDETMVAVLLIDLDRFKQINDTLGHSVGDMLLQIVASRLKGLALESDTLARLGGDEFVLLLPDLENMLCVPRTGQMILDQLSAPFELNGELISVTSSIGAARYPQDAADPENLLRLADIAMYEVKDSGRNAFRCFAPEMDQSSQYQMTLENDLRHALERNELVLTTSPKPICILATSRVSRH